MKEFTYVYDFGNNLIRYFRYIPKKSCFPLSDSILFFFTVKRQFSKLASSSQTIISFQGGYFAVKFLDAWHNKEFYKTYTYCFP